MVAVSRISAVWLCLSLTFIAPVVADELGDAWTAFEKKDFVAAVNLWEELSEKGSQYAQVNLGIMFATGQGVVKDEILAYKWLKLSSEQGNNLASQLFKGLSERMTKEQKNIAEGLIRETD